MPEPLPFIRVGTFTDPRRVKYSRLHPKLTFLASYLGLLCILALGDEAKYEFNRPVTLVGVVVMENAATGYGKSRSKDAEKNDPNFTLVLSHPIRIEEPNASATKMRGYIDYSKVTRFRINPNWKTEPSETVDREWRRTLRRHAEKHTTIGVEGTLFPIDTPHQRYPHIRADKISEVKTK